MGFNSSRDSSADGPASSSGAGASEDRPRVIGLSVAGGDPQRVRKTAWPHPFGELFEDVSSGGPSLVNVLWPEIGREPDAVTRISRVNAALATRESPFLATTREVSIDAERRLVLTYDRIAGEDLGTLLARGPLPVERAVAILCQLCRGLAAAHAAGVQHRALGPASVIVRSDGPHPDAVKILDFGLAGALGDAEPRFSLLLPTTPERLLGFGTHTSEDVYLVACLGYWMLAGKPAFVAADCDALWRRHAIEDVAPIKTIAPKVPRALRHAIEAALAKDPDERTPDLNALELALLGAQMEASISTPWDSDIKSLREQARALGERPATSGVFEQISGRGKRPVSGGYATVPATARPRGVSESSATMAAAAARPSTGPQTVVPTGTPRPTTGSQAVVPADPKRDAASVPASTVAAPKTAPSTAPPSTAPPSTAPPTSTAPSTAAPRTAAPPSTAAPSTPAPSTAPPRTAAPSTPAPSTAAPRTAAPSTAAPTSTAPTSTAPSTAAPTSTAPSTAAPSTAASSATAPRAESADPKRAATPTTVPKTLPKLARPGRLPPPPSTAGTTPEARPAAATPPTASVDATPTAPVEATPVREATPAAPVQTTAKPTEPTTTADPSSRLPAPSRVASAPPPVAARGSVDAVVQAFAAAAPQDAKRETPEAPRPATVAATASPRAARDVDPEDRETVALPSVPIASTRRPAWLLPAVAAAGIIAIVGFAFRGEDQKAPTESPTPIAVRDPSPTPPTTPPAPPPAPEPVVAAPPPVAPPITPPVAETVVTPPLPVPNPVVELTDEPPSPVEKPSSAASPKPDDPLRQQLARAKEARRKGKREEAIQAYQAALRIEPNNRGALRELSRMHFDAGNYDAAAKYGKTLVASGGAPADRVALGDAYFKLGRKADAAAQYEKASAAGDATAKKRLAKLGG